MSHNFANKNILIRDELSGGNHYDAIEAGLKFSIYLILTWLPHCLTGARMGEIKRFLRTFSFLNAMCPQHCMMM
jgi:hypothetical protein